MKNVLDSQRIEFPCPHCSGKLGQTVRQIKAQQDIRCPHCGKTFVVDARQFKREIAKIDEALEDLGKALRRLSK